MMNERLAAVEKYIERGFSLVPFIAVPPKPGESKWQKKPIVSWTDRQKRPADAKTIIQEFKNNPDALIGCCTGPVSGIVNLDVDTDEGSALANELVPDSLMVPTYETMSGGKQMVFEAPEQCPQGMVRFLPGLDFRGTGSCAILPGDRNGRYKWIDGLSLADVEPPPVPRALIGALLNNNNKYIYTQCEVTSNETDLNKPQVTSSDLKYFIDGTRDNDLFHTAYHLLKSGCDIRFVYQVLERLILSWGEKPDPKWIKAKIESAIQRVQKREINFADEVRDFVLTSNGLFLTSDVTNRLQLTSRQEKKNVVNVLLRLHKEGIIERAGQKDGCYRRIDRTIEFMDFENANVEDVVDVRLPLNLHLKSKFFPKAVINIMGVSGMGKTLFCFNAMAENFGKFPIFYFNSEMGPEALKMKLSYFPIPVSEWAKHMKVVDQWDFNNIADKIQPDAFNVIDYLEPDGDKPYNIHGVISSIIRRLNKGTALIAIQKKPDAKMGTGGIYSIKAATLAIALDWGKIEIVKNRFREADTLPSLNKINFEVYQGHKFVPQGGWYK